MRATERLARRLESERARGTRFKSRRRDEGMRQVVLWLSADDVAAVDRIKATMAAANRSEVISALLKGHQETVNRRAVVSAEVFEEGNYWRWRITDADGRSYVDGGNHRTREAALADLQRAYDPQRKDHQPCPATTASRAATATS